MKKKTKIPKKFACPQKKYYFCGVKFLNNNMAEQKKDIIIANPMYDAVFKSLMADKDNARCLVGTITGERILDIEFAPQEYIQEKNKDAETEKQTKQTKQTKPIETLKPIHLDFVTTIRTRDGSKKKVLIEIQQSLKPADVARFRTYMGNHYKNEDNLIKKGDRILKAMPIAVIYIIGDETPKTSHISDVAYKVKRSGVSLLTGEEISIKKPFDPLIEALTHDAYFIHVGRIAPELFSSGYKCRDLLQLLSLFEQINFVEENLLKIHNYPITNKYIQKMRNTLEYLATDPVTKRLMQEQRFAEMDVLSWKQTIKEQNRVIRRKDNTIIGLQSNNTALLAQLAEYQQRFGKLTPSLN
ncbi:MAG: hypothetical protein FWH18_07815 [Marinilabiliaceae bacterium]|nr:hypothetical protein [Marinilabiliaceae bacterium]